MRPVLDLPHETSYMRSGHASAKLVAAIIQMTHAVEHEVAATGDETAQQAHQPGLSAMS